MAKKKAVKKPAGKKTPAKKTAPAKAKAAAKTAKAAPSKARGTKYVYFFGNGKADGDRTMKDLLGGKGSGLAEMTNAGLPVPPGFTITTAACNLYYESGRKIPTAVEQQMEENLRKLQKVAGQQFGSVANP